MPARMGGALGENAAAAKSLQLCPTLCGPIDGSPPGSPVPGILQARTLEWIHVYIYMAEFLHCSPETITRLLINYIARESKKFRRKK